MNRTMEMLNDYLRGQYSFFRTAKDMYENLAYVPFESCPNGHKGIYLHGCREENTLEEDPKQILVIYFYCKKCREEHLGGNGYFSYSTCPSCHSFDVKFVKRTVTASDNRTYAIAHHEYACQKCASTWKILDVWSD